MSFFTKALFIVSASVAFVLILMYINSFKKSTVEDKETSNFKMEVLNVLQKLINDDNCLAFETDGTPQKSVIDINKLDLFRIQYSDIEPESAKALNFDYNIKVEQFPKNFTLYAGEIIYEEIEVMMEYLCSDPAYGNDFILISCNYDPETCPGICDACGEFDECSIPDCPSSCGNEPLNNCPYTGSCNVNQCPSEICCRYLRCPKDACDYVINTHEPHSNCWSAYGDCDLTKCRDVSCTRGNSANYCKYNGRQQDYGNTSICRRGSKDQPFFCEL